MSGLRVLAAAALFTQLVTSSTVSAQRWPDTLSATAYARAERFMQHKMGNKVYRAAADIHWLKDGYRFWYGVQTADGTEYNLVDPARNTKQLLIDRPQLAKALSAATDSIVEANRFTLANLELSENLKNVQFNFGAKRFDCDLVTYQCTTVARPAATDPAARRSPDGAWDAFVKDHDLYVRRVACTTDSDAGECAVRLTTDGNVNWSYGRAGTFGSISAARRSTPRTPMLVWSPDSKKIAIMRWDQRGVENFYYISSTTIRPELLVAPQSIPGDSIVERYDLYVADVTDKSLVRIETQQIPWVRGGMTEGVNASNFAHWAPGSDRFLFLSNDRGATRLSLMSADAKTGQARRLITDSILPGNTAISEYIISSGIWRRSRGNDVFWYSERDGASHIYRHDAGGKLLNKVTEGAWNVMDIVHADTIRGTFFLRGTGREPNTFRAHSKLYRVQPDGAGLTLLTPEPGEHTGNFSPDGRFFVDNYSQIDVPPVIVLRSTENGRVIRELERADISYAASLGWKPPTVFDVISADGVTRLHGVMWKPTNFDSTRRYPVVDHIYPMPLGSHTNWGFSGSGPASEYQALAEIGFIVVHIQPRGVRDPSPAIRNIYRTEYGGRYGEATLPDHVEALKQLGGRYPWFDISRIGLYGTSGGGFVTTAGMLRYPDFFKAGVAFAGNHDDRSEQNVVGESWRGLYKRDANGRDNYEGDANYLLAGNLKGKLMLVHGDLDEAVHPAMTIRLASALIDAGKRFDMMILPDQGHTSGGWYGSRLMFDYFVRHLMGLEPPEYPFTGTTDPVTMRRRTTK
ncbi:MAG: DPP IV N-terminal domain-containing protein [Longimicrobiales bacterium]